MIFLTRSRPNRGRRTATVAFVLALGLGVVAVVFVGDLARGYYRWRLQARPGALVEMADAPPGTLRWQVLRDYVLTHEGQERLRAVLFPATWRQFPRQASAWRAANVLPPSRGVYVQVRLTPEARFQGWGGTYHPDVHVTHAGFLRGDVNFYDPPEEGTALRRLLPLVPLLRPGFFEVASDPPLLGFVHVSEDASHLFWNVGLTREPTLPTE